MSHSRKAARNLTRSDAAPNFFVQNWGKHLLACTISFFVCTASALPQQDVPQQPPVQTSTTQPEVQQNPAELASHDEPTTFKVNVKLVLVRVVVRDGQGHAIGNLHQEDFQVFDKGKPQVITHFEVEQPGSMAAKARPKPKEDTSTGTPNDSSSNTGPTLAVPERFVAYLFDDVHLEFGDLARVREAAERHFSNLRPTDRAAIFTTSGRTVLDYTDDRTQLHATLLRLQPQPISSGIAKDCPDIGYYQADQIVNKNDPQALQVAVQEAISCQPTVPGTPPIDPTPMVNAISAGVVNAGQHESRIALGVMKEVVHNLSRMPGQRSVVLISPGFITPQLEYEYTEIIDRAVRSQVIVNTLDARGLYTIVPGGDISNPSQHLPPPAKGLIEIAAASAQDDLLSVLADGTGGVFFHNNNDFDEGFRCVADPPEYSYMLAFAPQNLKLNGSFHAIKVTVKSLPKLNVLARRGYYAPKNFANPEEQAKQEIEDATFSQEELHNLPVKLQTQFFKASSDDAKLIVLAHVDVRLMRFRKTDGRNNNILTCVSALFNRNGNLIQGIEKTVTMHLKDDTLEHKLGSGITLKTSFDVKPGSYMVRLVVRDSEAQLMSAENGTVEIR